MPDEEKMKSSWISLLEFLGFFEPQHCKMVRRLFLQREPTLQVIGTKILKREKDQTIVAIFFQEPKIRVKPARYKIFAVSNDLSRIDELPCDPTSPYWIKGRK
jgi:hypothetical protein